jgi:hypothetical protein
MLISVLVSSTYQPSHSTVEKKTPWGKKIHEYFESVAELRFGRGREQTCLKMQEMRVAKIGLSAKKDGTS